MGAEQRSLTASLRADECNRAMYMRGFQEDAYHYHLHVVCISAHLHMDEGHKPHRGQGHGNYCAGHHRASKRTSKPILDETTGDPLRTGV